MIEFTIWWRAAVADWFFMWELAISDYTEFEQMAQSVSEDP